MRYNPGDRVLIVEDCREGSPATGQEGVYEGDFPIGIWLCGPGGEPASGEYSFEAYDSGQLKWQHLSCRIARLAYPDPETAFANLAEVWDIPAKKLFPLLSPGAPQDKPFALAHNNPRIRLDDGSVIWGCQCWWRSLAEEPAHPLEEEKANLGLTKQFLRDLAAFIGQELGESADEDPGFCFEEPRDDE